jgi:hypothetical protein
MSESEVQSLLNCRRVNWKKQRKGEEILHHPYNQLQTENIKDGQQYIALQSASLRQQDPTIHYLSVRGQTFHINGITIQESKSDYK